jgi:hypothetical protein
VKDDVWELYNVDKDFSQADNLAAKKPAKLKELQAIFMKEAIRNHVLPIDDRRSERFNPRSPAGRICWGGARSLTVYPGMTGMLENAFINVKGVHHTVTAEVELTDEKSDGVIIAQAGYFGWLGALHEGRQAAPRVQFLRTRAHEHRRRHAPRPRQAHDPLRIHPRRCQTRHGRQVDPQCRWQKVAEGNIPKTQPFAFSGDEGADVGVDDETNVSPDYKQGDNAFTGKIIKVTVEQK